MNILDQLERDEGFVNHPYQDKRGFWTIGIGTLVDPAAGGGLTRAEARRLLQGRLEDSMVQLTAALPWITELDEARYGVLQNMVYNLGVAGLLGFHNTLAAVREKRWDDAARGMLDSKWAHQVGERATRLAKQMQTGVWQ